MSIDGHTHPYRVRPATHKDLGALLSLKADLMFSARSSDPTSTTGGFLLGSTPEEYQYKLSTGRVWVLEGTQIEGLALVLGDRAFRESEIWQRRDQVRWKTTPAANQCFAYFDQLAVRPGPARTHVPLLAMLALLDAYRDGVEVLLSTTVKYPIQNLAAVPYLRIIGAEIVGEVDENYPNFGPLVSDLWLTARSSIEAFLERPPMSVSSIVQDAKALYSQHRTSRP